MKNIILIILTLTFFNQKKINFNKKLVNYFCTELILNDKFSFLDTTKYIEYSPKIIKNEKDDQSFVMSLLNDLKTDLLKNNDYKIMDHKTFQKSKNFKTLKFSKEYKSSNTVHIISKDILITSFIIENKKIISFTCNMIKREDQVRTPFILNKLNFDNK